MNLTLQPSLLNSIPNLSNPNHSSQFPSLIRPFSQNRIYFSHLNPQINTQLGNHSFPLSLNSNCNLFKLPAVFIDISASSLFLLALGIFTLASHSKPHAAIAVDVSRHPTEEIIEKGSVSGQRDAENFEDEQLRDAFESWKSKTYALTVPLRVVALQGSVPPAWIKDFIQCQGRRSKLGVQFRGTLQGIFFELMKPSSKVNNSAITADLITLGDSWLDLAIANALIEPIKNAEDQDWFKGLTEKWKIYLHRNNEGKIDHEGRIWAVPYRWGSMVIAYKKSKFDKLGLAPIEDWADLWRPELAGRISMVDSPREIIGAVLKYMGASYNTNDIRKETPGGINAVQQNLIQLAKQVLLFDNTSYLKAFSVGDTWVAVGWSSDILPAAKRLSDVAVVVPKSGASLWADFWTIPATTRCPPTEKLGGRIRGPSPLIHQWLDFCLQPARELPFKQGVFPGASPSALEHTPTKDLPKGAPKLTTNLIAGIPPPTILSKCEFLEPLSEVALEDYKLLIASMQRAGRGPFQRFSSTISCVFRLKTEN